MERWLLKMKKVQRYFLDYEFSKNDKIPEIKNKNLFKFNTSFVVNFFKIVLASIIMGVFFNYLILIFQNQLIYDSNFKSFYLIFSVLLTLSFYLLLSFFIKAFNYKDLQLRY